MAFSLDVTVRSVYSSFREAVEPILATKHLRDAFVVQVQKHFPEATEDVVLQHLVKLRKRGQAKGGLLRKAR